MTTNTTEYTAVRVTRHSAVDFEQTRARRVFSAGFNARNHHVAAQAFPKTFDEEFHFAG